MLQKLQKRKEMKSEGFTIIEVLIVLAIAGLIILIVLLAVPALQRNSRNTAIKNDASSLAGAVTEFESNNDGLMATAGGSSQTGSTVSVSSGGTSAPATAKVQGSSVVGFSAAWPTAAGAVNVAFGQKCASSSALTANSRSAAILYNIEGSGATLTKQCIDA